MTGGFFLELLFLIPFFIGRHDVVWFNLLKPILEAVGCSYPTSFVKLRAKCVRTYGIGYTGT